MTSDTARYFENDSVSTYFLECFSSREASIAGTHYDAVVPSHLVASLVNSRMIAIREIGRMYRHHIHGEVWNKLTGYY
jgi:hypothetical protein